MNKARLFYGKDKKHVEKEEINSPFFRSKVQREINEKPDNSIGPGQYEVSLPFVKPVYETIVKNDNTIILKFNHNNSSAFHSKSPRFLYNDKIPKKMDNSYSYRQQSKSLVQQQNLSGQKPIRNSVIQLSGTILISEGNNKNNEGKQKSDRILKNSKLQRIRMFSEDKSKKSYLSDKFNEQYKRSYQSHSIPVVQRLHNYQPSLIYKKVFNQNRYHSQNKSTQWSKYKEQRRSFVDEPKNEYHPGPGTYKLKKPQFKNYNQRIESTSWQFNSKTLRNPFLFLQRKSELKDCIKTKNASQSLQEKYLLQDPELINMKSRVLSKKHSKTRFSDKKNTQKYNQQNDKIVQELNLQINSISYKESFFS